jgi:serine/threonine-protein kinase
MVAYLVLEHLSLGKRVTAADRDGGRSAVTIPTTGTPDAVQAFAPPAHSIAVLPFVNMSGDAKQEYFSDGISEELLDSRSRLNDLQVAARTSSFSFKGKDVDISTIAHELNVGAVLEGSVRRSGNTIRITVQLINAVTGFHIWSQSYDRKLTDILKLQTEVATSVAQQLEVKLVGDEGTKIELGGTKNADAYDAYLRGLQRYEEAHGTERDYRDALTAFDRAISLDPNYALAYTRRAAALDYIYRYPDDPNVRPAVLAQAHEAAERALALAPQLGEAHMVLAYTYYRGSARSCCSGPRVRPRRSPRARQRMGTTRLWLFCRQTRSFRARPGCGAPRRQPGSTEGADAPSARRGLDRRAPLR